MYKQLQAGGDRVQQFEVGGFNEPHLPNYCTYLPPLEAACRTICYTIYFWGKQLHGQQLICLDSRVYWSCFVKKMKLYAVGMHVH